MSEMRKLMEASNAMCEAYTVLPPIDRERYTDLEHEGLEGPFMLKSGKVVYYDKSAGKYYDRDTDMYISDEDYAAHNESKDPEIGSDEELFPDREGDGAVTDMKPDWKFKPEDSNENLNEFEEPSEDLISHLEDLQEQLMQVIGEIDNAMQGTQEYSRAKAYWLAQLHIAASDDNGYMSHDANMSQAIQALRDDMGGVNGYGDEEGDDHRNRNE